MRLFNSIQNTIYSGLIGLLLLGCKTEQVSVQPFGLNNAVDSISYSLGLSVALGVKSQGLDSISHEALTKAFEDVYTEQSPLLVETEADSILSAYFMDQVERISEENLAAGKKFMDENKTKEGVVTTASGLQYKIIESGTGEVPSISDQVTTHYTGKTITGEIFDSSIDRGEPVTFPVDGVISGWTEVLQLMPVGSKWQIYIPSELAYGPRGAGPKIGPNSVLIFDLELISIN